MPESLGSAFNTTKISATKEDLRSVNMAMRRGGRPDVFTMRAYKRKNFLINVVFASRCQLGKRFSKSLLLKGEPILCGVASGEQR